MTQPSLPEWPPNDDQLAEIANGLHWKLQEIGYDLAVRPHTVTDGRRKALAYDLTSFADLLRRTTETRRTT